MQTNWRKLGLVLLSSMGVYILLIGVAANFAQILSLEQGWRVLVLLLLVTVLYKVWEEARRFWQRYCALRARLTQAQDFILRSVSRGEIVLLCARTHWLFAQQVGHICVSKTRADKLVLDTNKALLNPEKLVGMYFSIMGADGKERARAKVTGYEETSLAWIELEKQKANLQVGDLAIPIEHPGATETERLFGELLFILSEQ